MRPVARQWRDEEPGLLTHAGLTIWSNLPLLLALNAVLLVGAVPAVVTYLGGLHILASLIGAFTLGPLWAGMVSVADAMVRDERVSVGRFLRDVRRLAVRGLAVGVVPAVIATALLGTSAIAAEHPDQRWMLLPLFVDGSLMTLVSLAAIWAFWLAVIRGLKGWTLWRASLTLAAASPLAMLGTVALLVLLAILVGWAGPGIVLALPAPFAVYLSAVARFTIQRRKGAEKI